LATVRDRKKKKRKKSLKNLGRKSSQKTWTYPAPDGGLAEVRFADSFKRISISRVLGTLTKRSVTISDRSKGRETADPWWIEGYQLHLGKQEIVPGRL